MEKSLCLSCQNARTVLHCGLCEEPTCKNCAHFLDEEAFSFLAEVPALLSKGTYCPTCFDAQVAETARQYEETMQAAREVNLFNKDQSKETRLMRREETTYTVQDCADRDELVLRLAFQAAAAGFDTLVDLEIVGEKIRNGSYVKTVYRGSAIPVKIRAGQVPKDRSLRHYPN